MYVTDHFPCLARLVTMLADLGQRGGILRLVGKLALLWGGIRGAMSLIGKLITFLRLSERPLFQRILGFVSLVLVLWTPFVVPLLPTLVQNWAEHNSSNFAVLACIIGLYSSVMILIVLWGTRIRGYEDPLKKYGLELTSAKQIQNFFYGLIGGVMLVLLIQSTNVFVGSVSISWPTIPSSTDAVTLLKLFGKGLRIVGQGLLTTAAVALVEEMLFRSWLPEEIAVDLGFNQGIILSGLAFSLSQWSPMAIPGLWLLSVGLSGVRQRCQGSLFVPIGLRTGIMASSFFLKEGGFLIYQPTYPLWLSGGGDPFQPFSSTVGLAVAILWALILYPRKHQQKIKE
ncbi:alpha/Beta hydrolase fold protein [Artemisia annua]|uniref:Alpha/Beta hydrolase fold protein n=1 Tax=Artemisia annua TaxID=35608 RepID=A0A2U1NQY1_ARTAN|nr:alpha/Beta hydrolase fold protein [Artemisia annua]